MTSDKTATSKREPAGRAEFLLRDDETVDVYLDRRGFRRLLKTLELLAQKGGRQAFEKSGRQSKVKNGADEKSQSLTRLAFEIEDGQNR